MQHLTFFKRLALHSVAVASILMVAGAIGMYRLGSQHQGAAIAFWGDQYDSEEKGLNWGFFLNIFMPSGGPLIAKEVVGICPDSPLPMVPVKFHPDGTGQALCGIGKQAVAVPFGLADIADEEMRDVLERLLRDEFFLR